MNALVIRNMDDAERAARAMSASGFFPDSKSAAQAVVKILAGAELGFGPFASMNGVNIIQGKPTLSANLIAAAVKRSGRYDYKIAQMDDRACVLDFYENGQKIGASAFSMADAERAGLAGKQVWKQYPKNMLFARAISNGVRWYAPDVFSGAVIYTPEELGADVNEEGNAINVEAPEPQIEQGENPDPVSDKVWDAWLALCVRAEKVNVPYSTNSRALFTQHDLIEAGKELRPVVEDAERQAAAGEEAQA